MVQNTNPHNLIEEPGELLKALRIARARSYWLDSTSDYRQNILQWIGKARRRSTKTKRIDTVVDHCVRGVRLTNY